MSPSRGQLEFGIQPWCPYRGHSTVDTTCLFLRISFHVVAVVDVESWLLLRLNVEAVNAFVIEGNTIL